MGEEEEDGTPDREVTPLPPTKDNRVSRIHHPPLPEGRNPGVQQPHPDALEAAQALITHSTSRLKGPEAWDVVAQVVQLQLWADGGSERKQTQPPPPPPPTNKSHLPGPLVGLHPSLP